MLTGLNVPEQIGEHYGPRPNPPIRAILAADNLFKRIVAAGGTTALLEGYPPRFHESVNRGKRLLASYQQAVVEAGFTLFDDQAIYNGDALPVDFTGEAWRGELGYTDTPLYTPVEAGHKLVELARRYTFSFFPHWYTDTLGHRGTMPQTIRSLEVFDGVMEGVLELWDPNEGLVIISSDHGNMEDMTQAHHTLNPVPTVVIGREAERFAGVRDLTDLAPLIEQYLIG
jgi:2,3-bisphosphoglycerate-independent phosphoglycerate mutase